MTDLTEGERVAAAAAAVIEKGRQRARVGVVAAAVLTLAPVILRVDSSSRAWFPLVVVSVVAVLRLPREVAELLRTTRWGGLVARKPWERRPMEMQLRPLERHRPLLVRAVDVDGEEHVFGQSTSPTARRLGQPLRALVDRGDREWWSCADSPRWMLLASDDGEHLVEVRRAMSSWGDRTLASRFTPQ